MRCLAEFEQLILSPLLLLDDEAYATIRAMAGGLIPRLTRQAEE